MGHLDIRQDPAWPCYEERKVGYVTHSCMQQRRHSGAHKCEGCGYKWPNARDA